MVNPNFCTTDMATCRDYISRYTDGRFLEVASPAHFLAFDHQATRLGEMAIDRVSLFCSQGFTMRKTKRATCFAFQFIEEGTCEVDDGKGGYHHAQAGDVLVLGSDSLSEASWSDACKQYVLRIEQDALADILSRNFGYQRRIAFKAVYRDPGLLGWLKEISRTTQQGDAAADGGLLANAQVRRHLGQSLIMMLLTGFDHNGSVSLRSSDSRSAPYYVRRVEKYFEHHYADDITMDQIVHIAGVSARTVFYGFQRWRHCSPMTYLRDMRLDIAREHLLNSGAGRHRISTVAAMVGYTNFGQFSKIYRTRFGEKPSETLLLHSRASQY